MSSYGICLWMEHQVLQAAGHESFRKDLIGLMYVIPYVLAFSASNNMTKYEALLNGMQIALEVGSTNL